MIPRRYIQQWRNKVSWVTDAQVEQDLVISRAIIEIFRHPVLKQSLAFRGGTALGKLFFDPQLRYSEDIDLVQIHAGPIKPIIDGIREALSFLGMPTVRQAKHNNTLRFSFDTEIPPVSNMKLKVEINKPLIPPQTVARFYGGDPVQTGGGVKGVDVFTLVAFFEFVVAPLIRQVVGLYPRSHREAGPI